MKTFHCYSSNISVLPLSPFSDGYNLEIGILGGGPSLVANRFEKPMALQRQREPDRAADVQHLLWGNHGDIPGHVL